MGVNHVKLSNGETLIDLRDDTVIPESLLPGYVATNAKGEKINGAANNLNADTVDGFHFKVQSSAPTVNDTSVFTVVANV
jgi:hypothetical protein